MRPALEDALGAGAILSCLPGPRSPEAEAAVAIFERYRDDLVTTLEREQRELGEQLFGAMPRARFDGLVAGLDDVLARLHELGLTHRAEDTP